MVQSSNGHTNQGWAKPEPGFRSLPNGQQALGPWSAAFPVTLPGSWVGMGAVGTGASTAVWDVH